MKFSSFSDVGNYLDNFYLCFLKKIFWEFFILINVGIFLDFSIINLY